MHVKQIHGMQGIGYKAKKIATQEYNARHTQQGVQCKEYNARSVNKNKK